MPDASNAPIHERLHQYQEKIRLLLDESNTLDSKMVEETQSLISQMKSEVISRIRQVQARIESPNGVEPEWGHFWLSRLVADFNQIVVGVSAKFRKNLLGYTIKAYEVGRDFADKGLEFAIPDLNLNDPNIDKLIPKLTKDQVRLAAQFPGDLITGMEEKQIQAITKEVSFSMSRNESPGELMARLEVGIDKGVWKTSYARAEVIARTEMARIQEIGRKHRLAQQTKAFPNVKMYTQYLVEPRLKWPCKMCAQYDGNVYDSDGKLFILAPGKKDGDAPDLPLHPNCLCCQVPFVPGVSVSPTEGSGSGSTEDQQNQPQPPNLRQAKISKLAWDDNLKIWILTLPDQSRRTMNFPKNSKEDLLQSESLRIVRNSGYKDLDNVVVIQHPSQLAGPDEGSYSGRAIHKSLGNWKKQKLHVPTKQWNPSSKKT